MARSGCTWHRRMECAAWQLPTARELKGSRRGARDTMRDHWKLLAAELQCSTTSGMRSIACARDAWPAGARKRRLQALQGRQPGAYIDCSRPERFLITAAANFYEEVSCLDDCAALKHQARLVARDYLLCRSCTQLAVDDPTRAG